MNPILIQIISLSKHIYMIDYHILCPEINSGESIYCRQKYKPKVYMMQ